MSGVRVVLLGGRSFPALLNLLYDAEHIDELIVFSTYQRRRAIDEFTRMVPPSFVGRIRRELIDAENFHQALNRMYEIISSINGDISIDITPAPKIPALAAWEVARKMGATIIYTSVSSTSQLRFSFKDGPKISRIPLSTRLLNLDTYISLYGRSLVENERLHLPNLKKPVERTAYEIGRYFIDRMNISIDFLKFMRCLVSGKAEKDMIHVSYSPQQGRCKNIPFRREYAQMLQFLYRMGVISSLHIEGESVKFRIGVLEAGFISGKWLEYYIYRVLDGSGLFHDSRFSVEIPAVETRNEIDFIGIRRDKGWLYIVEAKTGRVSRRDLDTLDSIAHLIGGNAVVRYMVVFGRNLSSSLRAQARERRINLLSAEDLYPEKLVESISRPRFEPI